MTSVPSAPTRVRRSPLAPVALALAAGLLAALAAPPEARAFRRRPAVHEAAGHLTFTSPQASPLALQPAGQPCSLGLLLVASTTSHRVDVIDAASQLVTGSVEVGMEPVSVAFRPDGCEAWVANHVSDSVSVIDTNPASPRFLRQVHVIQDLDAAGVTSFDEPVGVAFASNSKAYVALSSRNEIAVVDATTYGVSPARIPVRAQEPRAIAVANGRLYVAAFESGNQSELSACAVFTPTGTQCSFTLQDIGNFATNPNVPTAIKNIVIDLDLPDRDVFVYDTATDSEIKVASGVGTLLYGLAVDGADRVFVTQTDALNALNGIVGPNPPGALGDVNGDGAVNLADLDNRMFTNEVAILDCAGGSASCSVTQVVDLEPGFPDRATALATPYGVALSADASVLVATAAGTSRVFSMDTATGALLDQVDVGAIPRGVVFDSSGATGTAFVLNTLDNSVSVVSVGAGGALALGATLPVGADPTPDAVRRGRIAFNDAFASDSGTFSCASCHPDGHTDQLVWRIGGECSAVGCTPGEDAVRTTMPMRGLRDTLPLHWDGSLGDPFGGGHGSDAGAGANCTLGPGGDPKPCFRQLADASLSGVMCDQTASCPPGGTRLSEQEKDDMAVFLERISYPPARMRPVDDALSASAVAGFEDFFMNQSGGGGAATSTCADSDGGCHEFPHGTASNSETLALFEAPTMRGLNDRFIQFSMPVTSAEEIMQVTGGTPPWDPTVGFDEFTVFAGAFPNGFTPAYGVGPVDIFQMVEEATTGHSGALGRQVMLSEATTAGCSALCNDSCPLETLLQDLMEADERGVVNLRGAGLRNGNPVTLSYQQTSGLFQVGAGTFTCAQVVSDAQGPAPTLHATLTAHLRGAVSEDVPQPLLAPQNAQCGAGTGPTGDPDIPGGSSMTLESAHVEAGDAVFLNGQPTGIVLSAGDITPGAGGAGCSFVQGVVTPDLVTLSGLPRTGGTDLLSIRSTEGLLSNEIPLP